MEKTIIMVLCLVAAVSMLLNVVFVKTIVALKGKKNETKKAHKALNRSLIKSICLVSKEAGVFEERIKKLEYQLDVASDLLHEYRTIALNSKNKYEAVLDNYMTVSQTLCDFIRDGRVIKTKYMDNIITYDFNSLTKQESEDFFGKHIM